MSLEAHERPRTFEQILSAEYSGNLYECCKEIGVGKNYSDICLFLNGHTSSSFVETALKRISAFFGESVSSLFPSEMYRSTFSSLSETPVYKILQERFGLHFYGKNTKSLFALFKEKRLTGTDYGHFCNIACGNFSLNRSRSFILRISEVLELSPETLFPPDQYSALEPQRIPFDRHIASIEETAFNGDIYQTVELGEFDIHHADELCDLIEEALACMTEKQRAAYRARFLSDSGSVVGFRDILGMGEYQNIQQLIKNGRKRVLALAPFLQERWVALEQERTARDDRVFGVRSAAPTDMPSDYTS